MRSRERAGRSTANTKFRRLNRPPKGERWSWIPLELIDSPAWRCLTRQDHLGACLSSRWHFRSESDSVLLHEQAFPPLEDRPGAASAAERAGLRAEGPSVAFHRGAGPGEPGPG